MVRLPDVTTAFESTYAGFRMLGLASAELELRCVPELGGRVFSLISGRTGREWLWRQPRVPALFHPADQRDFGTGTFAGLDECLPTIGACDWLDGRELADHGEVWAQAWTVEEHTKDGLALVVGVPALGLRLARRIRLEGNLVRFDYTLENSAGVPAPALWAMHPLFALASGDRLELPAEESELQLGAERPAVGGAAPLISVAEKMPGVKLDELELPDRRNGFLKCFTRPLPAGRARAALVNPPGGDRLEVQWDTEANPYLGLWLTRGGFRGWHHVALEPTNAPHDRVDIAATDPALAPAVTLAPGARRNWWVEWRVA